MCIAPNNSAGGQGAAFSQPFDRTSDLQSCVNTLLPSSENHPQKYSAAHPKTGPWRNISPIYSQNLADMISHNSVQTITKRSVFLAPEASASGQDLHDLPSC